MSDEAGYTEEELQAIWMEFQREGHALCPHDGAELEIELDEAASQPVVRVRCPDGDHGGTFSPPDSVDVQAWAE